MRVPLSLACGAYDRTFALARGDIQPGRPSGPGLIRRQPSSAELCAAETREAYVI